MYEMVSFHRGSTIPTSHIHMYDPDNVTVAVSIFRVSDCGRRRPACFSAYNPPASGADSIFRTFASTPGAT